mgnify:CR=1 FL=1
MTREPWNDFGTPTEPKPSVARRLTRKHLIGIGAFALLIAGIWEVQKARAHEAPTGWAFDPACCGNGDCKPIPASDIRETASGYLIVPTNEVIPYQSSKVRVSPDGKSYRCSVGGKRTGNTYCVYVNKGGV